MIRIVVKTVDWEAVMHIPGALTESKIRTFDVCLPELETYLAEFKGRIHGQREVVGVEIIHEPPKEPKA